jgi:hypothetical protein
MLEIEALSGAGSDLDQRLLLRMTEIQSFLDAASAALEADKIRLVRERLGEEADGVSRARPSRRSV